jgi:hypothetical protein
MSVSDVTDIAVMTKQKHLKRESAGLIAETELDLREIAEMMSERLEDDSDSDSEVGDSESSDDDNEDVEKNSDEKDGGAVHGGD